MQAWSTQRAQGAGEHPGSVGCCRREVFCTTVGMDIKPYHLCFMLFPYIWAFSKHLEIEKKILEGIEPSRACDAKTLSTFTIASRCPHAPCLALLASLPSLHLYITSGSLCLLPLVPSGVPSVFPWMPHCVHRPLIPASQSLSVCPLTLLILYMWPSVHSVPC